jgi:hypothetical protein
MAPTIRPRNWGRIVTIIKTRADYQCECGTMWDCGSNWHPGRCLNVEGKRYQHNSREIKLRVVQIGADDNWTPNYLIALCLPCLRVYEEKRMAREQEQQRIKAIEAQMNPLFDIEELERKHRGPREQN